MNIEDEQDRPEQKRKKEKKKHPHLIPLDIYLTRANNLKDQTDGGFGLRALGRHIEGIGRDLGDIGEEGGVPVEPRTWRVRVLNYSVS